jgi:hypothetical protein
MANLNQLNKKISVKESKIFEEINSTHTLHIEPFYLKDFETGIRIHLDHLLFKYSPRLLGIPLSYSNITYDKYTSLPIFYDNPCVHINVRATWLLFSPQPGCRLMGTINAISREHIGLLAFNYFSAYISASHLETLLHWSAEQETWTSNSDWSLGLGDILPFELIEVLAIDGPVCTLIGSLDKLLEPATSIKTAKRKVLASSTPAAKRILSS